MKRAGWEDGPSRTNAGSYFLCFFLWPLARSSRSWWISFLSSLTSARSLETLLVSLLSSLRSPAICLSCPFRISFMSSRLSLATSRWSLRIFLTSECSSFLSLRISLRSALICFFFLCSSAREAGEVIAVSAIQQIRVPHSVFITAFLLGYRDQTGSRTRHDRLCGLPSTIIPATNQAVVIGGVPLFRGNVMLRQR